jgi:hypothetical protein
MQQSANSTQNRGKQSKFLKPVQSGTFINTKTKSKQLNLHLYWQLTLKTVEE